MILVNKAFKHWGLVWTIAILAPLVVQAETVAPIDDELVLKNGSRLFGTVVSVRDRLVTLKTNFAGTLSISMDEIVSVNNRNPVTILLADQTVVSSTSLIINQENLVLPDSAQTYPMEDLGVLNPEPWELGKGYRWTGSVSFALAAQRGNTDTDTLNVRVDPVWRSKQDRYTLKASGEQDETNGQESANNWQLIGKYDYFLTDPKYVGLLLSAENDKFQDLDIRYLIGRRLLWQPVLRQTRFLPEWRDWVFLCDRGVHRRRRATVWREHLEPEGSEQLSGRQVGAVFRPDGHLEFEGYLRCYS